jgi:hypothetical protein
MKPRTEFEQQLLLSLRGGVVCCSLLEIFHLYEANDNMLSAI